MLKKVVLPAPFGPISPAMLPRSITKSTLFTAVNPPNCFVTPVASRIGAMGPRYVLRVTCYVLRKSTFCRSMKALYGSRNTQHAILLRCQLRITLGVVERGVLAPRGSFVGMQLQLAAPVRRQSFRPDLH